jgi:DNA polymerase III subunit gamma/tau
MVDRVQLAQPAPNRRRLLSSRPAEAAERREPGLLDPVSTTLQATARETPKVASGPVDRLAKITSGPAGRVAKIASPVTGAVVRPVGSVLAPVESALVPVGSALVPVAGAVGGLVSPVVPGGLPPLAGLPGSGTGSRGGPGDQGPAGASTGVDGAAPAASVPAVSQTIVRQER